METTQERGVKVKWPSKRMTIGDMNKRVRHILEYVTREQLLLDERRARAEALQEAISSGKYKPLTPEPSNSMDIDTPNLAMDEDVKPTIEIDGQVAAVATPPTKVSRLGRSRHASPEASPDNPTIAWSKRNTDEMLSDLLTDILAFQEKYRPRSRKRESGIGAAPA